MRKYVKHVPSLAARARELGVSRQRVWQLLKQEEGKCITCGQEVHKNGLGFKANLCLKHLTEHRTRERERHQK